MKGGLEELEGGKHQKPLFGFSTNLKFMDIHTHHLKKKLSCVQGPLWEYLRAGRFQTTLLLRTTRSRSQLFAGVSGVAVTNKQTKKRSAWQRS